MHVHGWPDFVFGSSGLNWAGPAVQFMAQSGS